MREYSTPPLVETPRTGGLADSVYLVAEEDPHLVQLMRRDPSAGDEWSEVSAATFRDEVLALAKGLLANGIRLGDRVALMARTRYEWTLFDYALWSIGAVPVPIYSTSSADQVRWILADTGAVACMVEHEDHAMTVGAVCDAVPSLRSIWQLDSDCVRELMADGTAVSDELVHRHRAAVTPGTAATVIYTSGTTGRPKGCVLTHANFAAECDNLLTGWREVFARRAGEQPATLLFLPLAHVYARMVQVAALRGGVTLGHQSETSANVLLPALASFRPTFLLAVPYIFERIFHKARRAAEEHGRAELFDKAADVAVRYAEAAERRTLGEGSGPGAGLRLQHQFYDRTVYTRVRAVLGGRMRNAMCGGSPLSREIGLFFAGAGVTVIEGYGLTETTAAVTVNPPGRIKYGTVGRPVPGTTVGIAEDGEVWIRGGTVFAGYLNAPDATGQVLQRGWLATGDLGSLDDEGYLTITGRKKEIIVTSGGKSIAPAVLEERVRAHPLVSQCLVVGDNRPFVGALITLDPEALAHWNRVHRKPPAEPQQLLADDDLQDEIQRLVVTANTVVSRAESIRAFRILPEQFTEESGLLTPSLKLRRRAISKAYAKDIEELYAPS
ncbi:AMP-dependent synthetase/ligase [Peterkaempfera griseoplana]|uniref:AMP-dependent synthetase/ligase n=1 Tax=Peterkaempfera griseoplana TaxID=66896 RepID=UPI0006E3C961|nr:AMP-dependent synthetase/ligase [Peterkaempfera griseoplana]